MPATTSVFLKEKQREKVHAHRREGNVKTEAKIGMTRLQTIDSYQSLEDSRINSSLELLMGTQSC